MSKTSDDNRLGIFHNLSEEMRQPLLVLTREDSPVAWEYDKYALSRQIAEKSHKEELIKEQCNIQASETFIDALYYHEMYNSAACWKTVSS